MRGVRPVVVTVAVMLQVAALSGVCAAGRIGTGAVGAGIHGAFTSVEGQTSGAFGFDLHLFTALGSFTPRVGMSTDYARVADLDALDVEASVAVMRRILDSSAYPFVALGGGVRQEWIGSFSQARFPVGFDVGLTSLIGTTAAFTAVYRFRRILDDPISNFNEHRVIVGLSLLFRNAGGNR